IPPASIDPVKLVGPHGRRDSLDVGGRQGNFVRIAPHEAHKPPVGDHGDRVAREQGALPIRAAGPMEDRAAVEVTPRLHQRETGERGEGAFPIGQCGIGPHHQFPIGPWNVDWRASEGLAPLHADTVEVWMGEGDSVKATALFDCGNALLVDEPEAIPEEVAGRRLDQESPLSDPNWRIAADAGEAGLEVADFDVAAFRAQLGQRGPPLTLGWDVLALVLADRAGRRGCSRWGLLDAAGPADPGFHGLTLPRLTDPRRSPRILCPNGPEPAIPLDRDPGSTGGAAGAPAPSARVPAPLRALAGSSGGGRGRPYLFPAPRLVHDHYRRPGARRCVAGRVGRPPDAGPAIDIHTRHWPDLLRAGGGPVWAVRDPGIS